MVFTVFSAISFVLTCLLMAWWADFSSRVRSVSGLLWTCARRLSDIDTLPWTERYAYACVRFAKRLSRPGIKLRVLRGFQQLLSERGVAHRRNAALCECRGSFLESSENRRSMPVCCPFVLKIRRGIAGCANRRWWSVLSASLLPKKNVDLVSDVPGNCYTH